MLERVLAPSLVSQLGSPSPLRSLVGDREDRVRQPPPERLVVAELLEQLMYMEREERSGQTTILRRPGFANGRVNVGRSMSVTRSSPSTLSSCSNAVITRRSALSCSIRAFCLSEFCLAFW